MRVLGRSSVEFRDGVKTYVQTLYAGGRAIDLVEEKAESDAKRWVAQNRTSLAALRSGIQQIETATGDQYLHGDSPTAIIEAYAKLARLWATGTRQGGVGAATQQDAREQRRRLKASGAPLTQLLQETMDFFREVLKQTSRLMKAKRAGKLGDLEGFLNESLGLTEEAAHVAGVEQEVAQINGDTFSVRPVPYVENIEAAFRQKLPPNAILELGVPGPILKAAGLPEMPLRIRQSKIRKKRGKHSELELEALKQLPGALNDPMMVYISPGDAKAFSIITTIPTAQGPIAAYFTTREENGETALEAKSIYGRTPDRVIAEIKDAEEQGLIRYKNEKAFSEWLSAQGDGAAKNDASTQHNRSAEDQVSLFNENEESQTPGTYSLSLSDRLEAVSAALGEQVQAQPEQHAALLQRAREHLATAHATWAAQPTSTSAQQQALRSLDAVLTVLPPEARAQLGGFLQLSSLSTAAARHTEIEKRFTQLTDYLAQPPATQAGDATARLSSFIPSGEKPVNPGNDGTKGPEGLTSQSGTVPPGEGNSRSLDYTRLPSPLFVPGQQIVEVFGGENSQIPGAINVDLRAQQGIKDSVENISRHFAPKSQDLIVASNPYGLPMEAWLIEASKVLKKGGRIVINGTKGNKFIKVPENQVLKEMGFKLVVEKTALAEDFKDHFFKTTDGRELFHKAVMTTIIEKIND